MVPSLFRLLTQQYFYIQYDPERLVHTVHTVLKLMEPETRYHENILCTLKKIRGDSRRKSLIF